MPREDSAHAVEMTKYFPTVPGVNLGNLKIHEVGKYSVTRPRDADDVLQTLLKFIDMSSCPAPKERKHTLSIIDATACVGGDTISFASAFQKVISVEKDPNTFELLKNNIGVYKLLHDKVLPINADFVELLKHEALPFPVDIIYMDPPWNPEGQPWHSGLKKLMLKLSDMPVYDVVRLAMRNTPARTVAVKVPQNFDFRTFVKKLSDVLLMVHSVSSFYIIFCSLPPRAVDVVPRKTSKRIPDLPTVRAVKPTRALVH
jgi:16S rRNA G966 N2-methylase RsmD